MGLLEPAPEKRANAWNRSPDELRWKKHSRGSFASRITTKGKHMTQKQVARVTIDVDDEGYMTNHAQWNRDVAAALAKEQGIELADAHWKVLDFIDKDFKERSVVPGMRRMNKIGGIPTKDLYSLFPDGPIKKAAKIAGYPKPVSCV
jgi:dissimilatory sulfite reductase related protein